MGHGAYNPLGPQGAAFLTFQAISFVTSQYFLAEIAKNMKMMNQKLTDILDFLYGDKKAELLSEISFIKYAYTNYQSIAGHPAQQAATIASLQESYKVAMKDIEFYMEDLRKVVQNAGGNLAKSVEQAIGIKDSLELSMQLYGFSQILEVVYAQNYDPAYLQSITDMMHGYFNKCEKRMLSEFSSLKGKLAAGQKDVLQQLMKGNIAKPMEKVNAVISQLDKEGDSNLRVSMQQTLQALSQPTTYFVTQNGSVYLEKC